MENELTDMLLSREQVAAIFNVSPRTVDNWIRTGQMFRADTPGNIVRIPRSEVERRMRAVPVLLDTEQPEAE